MGRFTIFKGQDNKWYFNLKARNGEIVCASQGYTSKQGAKKGIRALRTAALLCRTKVES